MENNNKRYDEALERARDFYEFCKKSGTKNTAEIILNIFPELRESKDERIRKTLIEFFSRGAECNSSTNGIPDKDILAWLEKHKYTEEDLDKAYKCADEVQYRRGYEDAKKEIEKQGEQKESPCDRCKRAHPSHSCQDITELGRCYLEHEKQGEQKPADKVEQEYHCTGVREPKEATGVLKQLLNKENYAWSEEDEAYRVDILVKLEPHITDDNFTDVQNWFKSIKERYLWKPSEEQMDALADALSLAKNCGEESSFHLRRLYEQLKKQREE